MYHFMPSQSFVLVFGVSGAAAADGCRWGQVRTRAERTKVGGLTVVEDNDTQGTSKFFDEGDGPGIIFPFYCLAIVEHSVSCGAAEVLEAGRVEGDRSIPATDVLIERVHFPSPFRHLGATASFPVSFIWPLMSLFALRNAPLRTSFTDHSYPPPNSSVDMWARYLAIDDRCYRRQSDSPALVHGLKRSRAYLPKTSTQT